MDKIYHKSLPEKTADGISDLIYRENYGAGAKLPGEKELAARLEVSRNTVRQAIRILREKQIVEVRRGAGTFVSARRGLSDDLLGLSLVSDKKKLVRDLLELRLLIEPRMAALAAELGLRRTPRLLRTGEADAPLVVGLGRPVLLLPGRPLPADEREVVLLHELTHLRRHDLAHKALLFVPCAVHWFNPLVWWMAREAGRTLELCCDARVVRGRDEAFRRRYGTALLHLAAGGRGPQMFPAPIKKR